MANTYTVFDHIETLPGGRETLMKDIAPDYPYLAVRSEHDLYLEQTASWHWHQELELFYVKSGCVEVITPHEHKVLEAGTAGLVNANVLHATCAHEGMPKSNMLIHMFRPTLLADAKSRIYATYIEPVLNATSLELVSFSPEDNKQLVQAIKRSFRTYEQAGPNWEFALRNQLSDIWLSMYGLVESRLGDGPARMSRAADERLKTMMTFVGEHYFEHIGVPEIAESAFASERDCYRTFSEALGVSPAQYVRDYRITQACRLLANTMRPIAQVGEQTGLGSPSHFGQVFREALGTTPSEYRKQHQVYESADV